MGGENSKVCEGGPTLIFACSGAADVGEISDRAARKMSKDGIGTMFCLAGIGGGIEQIMQKTSSASKILAIDGCDLDCVKSCLEKAEFTKFKHLRVTNMNMEKGKSPASEENVNTVAAKGKNILN